MMLGYVRTLNWLGGIHEVLNWVLQQSTPKNMNTFYRTDSLNERVSELSVLSNSHLTNTAWRWEVGNEKFAI